ncbi:YceI family protein [Limnohabitans sp.]|uniref:YceI family protein n=1 Tax=Limnohabitans sp. TaxID=1907725 RepID=UPI0035B0AC63
MKYLFTTLTLSTIVLGSAQAASYQAVVPEKSAITFSYKQMGVAMDGKFRKFNAQVSLDTAKLDKAKGSIDIDLASIDTGSSEADQEVVGKSWFNVAAHPKASFVLKSLKSTGASQYEAMGQLTIKGQTRDITAPLKLSPQGALTGSFLLKRADFGIGEGMWAKFDVVANEITVHFNLNLK